MIFAVAVGMAVGASHPSVALSGIAVVGIGGVRDEPAARPQRPDPYCSKCASVSGTTSRACSRPASTRTCAEPAADVDVDGATGHGDRGLVPGRRSRSESSAGELVKALNRIEGVQSVSLAGITSTSNQIRSAKSGLAMTNAIAQRLWITMLRPGSLASLPAWCGYCCSAHRPGAGTAQAPAAQAFRAYRRRSPAAGGPVVPAVRAPDRRAVRQERRQAARRRGAQGRA